MATFDDSGVSVVTAGSTTPTYGVNKTVSPKVSVINLGDGYTHRLRQGLTSQLSPAQWSLEWNVKSADGDKIEEFFEANIATYFNWTPPQSSTAGKYVCSQWTRRIPYLNRCVISATFNQVFDLG